jgi:hypothetical protein
VISIDEGPGKVKLDKIPTLKPAFKKDGTITAASSSSINDGAAALVMMTREHRQAPGRQAAGPHRRPRHLCAGARMVHHRAGRRHVRSCWQEDRLEASDVDLWEVNEAFAVVPMALMEELKVSHDIVNVNGGACALGHPIGASGARIMVTLIHALKARGGKRGIATLCIGGGEGTAEHGASSWFKRPSLTTRPSRPMNPLTPMSSSSAPRAASASSSCASTARRATRVIATARDDEGLQRLRPGRQGACAWTSPTPASISGLAWQLDGEKIDLALYVAGVFARRRHAAGARGVRP